MPTSVRSEELKQLLTKIHQKNATGFVSITVQDGARPVYGTLQVSQGQLLSAQFKNFTGRSAIEQIGGLESPDISFARSNVTTPRDADIPEITDIIDLSQGPRAQAQRRANRQAGVVTTGVATGVTGTGVTGTGVTGTGARAASRGATQDTGRGLSVRSKMLLLFSVLPMLILAGLGAFYVSQLRNMSDTLTDESEAIVTTMAEERIQLVASNVAAEVGRYLAANPELTKQQFQTDPEFLQIALQRVGSTGYTTLIEEASGTGDPNSMFFWVHPDPRIIGAPLAALASQFGEVFPGLSALLTQAAQAPDNQTNGYYDWPDSDGVVRAKHLASARIEGTPFYIASTTYISEFTEPMVELKDSSNEILNRSQLFVIIAVISAILFTLFSVALYGNRLSKKIQAISDVADAISMGNLDTDIEGTERKDEIGMLARAIERLRTSVQVMFTELNSQ